MSLLSLYVFSFIVGGVFVALSVFSGLDKTFDVDKGLDIDKDLDGDGDLDADHDLDVDKDLDIDKDLDVDKSLGVDKSFDKDVETGALGVTGRPWRPWRSFKFWTFFMGFFGLTGTLFTALSLWSSVGGVLALSLALGLFAGLGISYGLHFASSSVGGKVAGERDMVGLQAQVVLPISGQQLGKVKLRYKGRLMELTARPDEDDVVFAFNEECVVLDVEDGVARVASASSVYDRRKT